MKFPDDLNDKDVQDQWRRLQAAIEAGQTAAEQSQPARSFLMRRKWYPGIAASLALVLVVSLWLTLGPSPRVTYRTAYGQQKHIVLPDSSRVILNANSSLSFGGDWRSEAPRRVELSGEAFFSVVHTLNDRQFIVETPEGMEVKVLGTEFNVYDRNGTQRVILNSGSVRLEYNDQKTVSLRPGDMVSRQGNGTRPEKRKVDPSRYTSWISGKLIFDNTAVKDVCRVIADNFGRRVTLPDTLLGNRLFNGTFPADDGEILIKALTTTYNLEAVKSGNTVRLRRKQTFRPNRSDDQNE